MSASKSPEKNMSFEKALERLEKIVAEMEAGTLPLEKMMQSFEEGSRLLRFCAQKLNEVEQKVEILLKDENLFALKPFQPAADGDEEKTDREDLPYDQSHS